MEKTVSAVLVAAGSSTRMGFDKLSFDLGGETVLHRSIRAFAQCPLVDEIVLVAGGQVTGRGSVDELYPQILTDTVSGCNMLEVNGTC